MLNHYFQSALKYTIVLLTLHRLRKLRKESEIWACVRKRMSLVSTCIRIEIKDIIVYLYVYVYVCMCVCMYVYRHSLQTVMMNTIMVVIMLIIIMINLHVIISISVTEWSAPLRCVAGSILHVSSLMGCKYGIFFEFFFSYLNKKHVRVRPPLPFPLFSIHRS
jgi:hypothetical protein